MTFIFSTPKGGLKHSAPALRALVECMHAHIHTHIRAHSCTLKKRRERMKNKPFTVERNKEIAIM